MLKTRIITAGLMLAVFIPSLFYMPLMAWAVLMMLLSLVGLREWAVMQSLSQQQTRIYMAIGGVLSVALMLDLWQMGFHGFFYQSLILFFASVIFWLLVVPVRLFNNRMFEGQITNLLLGLFLLFTLAIALITAKEINPQFLLVIISTIWVADSAAYMAGKQFGQHKLAPSISPGKTWEGVLGALFAVGLYAVIMKLLGIVNTWWVLPCLWVVTIVGVYGDLLESWYKRRANIKDSGSILPGHGGLLDRIDGVIPALPIGLWMVYCYHYFKFAYSF